MAEPVFVKVLWKDAWSDTNDFIKIDRAKEEHRPAIIETVGWLLVDDDEGVSVFSEKCLEEGSYRGRTFVPRGMIITVEPYRLSKPRRAKPVPAP